MFAVMNGVIIANEGQRWLVICRLLLFAVL